MTGPEGQKQNLEGAVSRRGERRRQGEKYVYNVNNNPIFFRCLVALFFSHEGPLLASFPLRLRLAKSKISRADVTVNLFIPIAQTRD